MNRAEPNDREIKYLESIRRGSQVRLEVRCRVHLRWCMVTLERTLEWRSGRADARGSNFRLLRAIAVAHQAVIVLNSLLAAPNPPGDQGETSKYDGTTDADNDADDDVLGLSRHTR